MNLAEKLARKEVARLSPYVCARDLYKNGKIMLDANENLFGPSVAKAPFGIALNRYPDSSQGALRKAIAKYAKVEAENILVGNGSDEIIDLAMRTFVSSGENIISVEPGYSMYEVCAKAQGANVKRVLLGKDFRLDSNAVLQAVDEKTKIIFIVSPNSPVGCEMELEAILKLVRSARALVFVDEAYIEFGGISLAQEVRKYQNLIVSRTLSKAWGLAGIRVGYAIASKQAISLMRRIKPPYNVNSLSAAIALEAVAKNSARMRKNAERIRGEREKLAKKLAALGFFVFPSVCNFLLVRPPQTSISAGRMQKALAQKGIIVRDRSNMPLLQNTFRITIGTQEQNAQLVSGIKKLMGANFDAVLFDMDGVLVDVSASYRVAIEKAANKYFQKTGMDCKILQADVSKIKSISGFNNDWDATYALVNAQKSCTRAEDAKPLTEKEKKSPLYAELREFFQNFYLGGLMQKEKPLISTRTLNALCAAGLQMCLVTGRPRKEAQFAIENNKWEKYFPKGSIVALEDCEYEKPNPAPLLLAMKKLRAKNPIYVGDSISDVAACKSASLRCISVRNEIKADFNVPATDDILEVLL